MTYLQTANCWGEKLGMYNIKIDFAKKTSSKIPPDAFPKTDLLSGSDCAAAGQGRRCRTMIIPLGEANTPVNRREYWDSGTGEIKCLSEMERTKRYLFAISNRAQNPVNRLTFLDFRQKCAEVQISALLADAARASSWEEKLRPKKRRKTLRDRGVNRRCGEDSGEANHMQWTKWGRIVAIAACAIFLSTSSYEKLSTAQFSVR